MSGGEKRSRDPQTATNAARLDGRTWSFCDAAEDDKDVSDCFENFYFGGGPRGTRPGLSRHDPR
jgi:hypothetical protein